jgi:hypothetical protein
MLQRLIELAQYASIAFTERRAQAGIDASVGSVGDALDNALAESVIGLYKTELIKPRRPWRTADEVEAATLHYVHWFNHERLLETNGDIPPVELEQTYHQHRLRRSRITQEVESPDLPGRFSMRSSKWRGPTLRSSKSALGSTRQPPARRATSVRHSSRPPDQR